VGARPDGIFRCDKPAASSVAAVTTPADRGLHAVGPLSHRSRGTVMTEASGPEPIPQIAAIISEIDTCLFTTRGKGGQLHARPMSNNGQVEWDGRSWFFAPSAGRLVAELRSDPSAVAAYRAEEGYTF